MDRTIDPLFMAEIRNLPCLACGTRWRVEAHHVKPRSQGGGDDWYNVIPLCSNHHTQNAIAWHRGRDRFLKAFPHILEHLIKLGWEYQYGKLFRSKDATL
jgi:5-methylcytosine-specific restriction endonuclease McrA